MGKAKKQSDLLNKITHESQELVTSSKHGSKAEGGAKHRTALKAVSPHHSDIHTHLHPAKQLPPSLAEKVKRQVPGLGNDRQGRWWEHILMVGDYENVFTLNTVKFLSPSWLPESWQPGHQHLGRLGDLSLRNLLAHEGNQKALALRAAQDNCPARLYFSDIHNNPTTSPKYLLI